MINEFSANFVTCSNDFNPASFPHAIISSIMSCLTSGLLQRTLRVPGMLFSWAQHLTTSTSGTTMAIIQLCNKNEIKIRPLKCTLNYF